MSRSLAKPLKDRIQRSFQAVQAKESLVSAANPHSIDHLLNSWSMICQGSGKSYPANSGRKRTASPSSCFTFLSHQNWKPEYHQSGNMRADISNLCILAHTFCLLCHLQIPYGSSEGFQVAQWQRNHYQHERVDRFHPWVGDPQRRHSNHPVFSVPENPMDREPACTSVHRASTESDMTEVTELHTMVLVIE